MSAVTNPAWRILAWIEDLPRPVSVAASLAGLCTIAIGIWLVFAPPTRTVAVAPASISHNAEVGYLFAVGDRTLFRGDTSFSPTASRVLLLEDGRRLGPPHSVHTDIGSVGGGAYSFWGRTLVFSTPDGSDPRTNGRGYTLEGPWLLAQLAGGAMASIGLVLASVHLFARARLSRRPEHVRRMLERLRHPSLWLRDWPRPAAITVSVLAFGTIFAGIWLILAPPTRSFEIKPGEIRHYTGSSYSIIIADPWLFAGDTNFAPTRSQIVLFEDGRRLGPRHTTHADIEANGGGAYSLWGQSLSFSTSDVSDPRTNGRVYTLEGPWRAAQAAGWGLFLFGTALLALRLAAAASHAPRGPPGDLRPVAAAALTLPAAGFWHVAAASDPAHAIDVVILTGTMAFGIAIAILVGGKPLIRWGALAGACAGLVVLLNGLLLAQGPITPAIVPDSASYMSINSCRTPGYYVLLAPFRSADSAWIAFAQLNLVIASALSAVAAVAYLTRSALAGMAVLIFLVLYGEHFSPALSFVTEPAFNALTGFAVAGALAYLRSPRFLFAALTGIAIAGAIAVKAVAPVFIIPAAALLLRPAAGRGRSALGLVGIPILCILALMTAGRLTHGSWSPTNFAGYSLVGHVAWGIAADERSSDPELSAEIERRMQPFSADWPSPLDFNAYLDRTINDYNPMLWGQIVPLVAAHTPDEHSQGQCPKAYNETFMALSREAIARHPDRYAAHVVVHYLGLWSMTTSVEAWERALPSYVEHNVREFAQDPPGSSRWGGVPDNWLPTPERVAAMDDNLDRSRSISLLSSTIKEVIRKAGNINQDIGLLFGVIASLLSALLLVMGRLDPRLAGLVFAAGTVCAYFGAHTLFQVALSRYASSVHIAVATMMGLAVYLAISRLRQFARGRRGRIN